MKGPRHYHISQCGFLFLLALFFSCKSSDEKMDGILSHQDMVKVLAEVYIAEQKITSLGISPDSAKQVLDLMGRAIYAQTQIPDSTFRRSMAYYADRPAEMQAIYGMLVDSLQLREQRVFRPGPQ